MSTKRKINKILKVKDLTANLKSDDCGCRTIIFDQESTDLLISQDWPSIIEISNLGAGLEELLELPVSLKEQHHD